MQFAFIGFDKPGDLTRRTTIRPEHLKHLETLGEQLLLAGPFLDEVGNMVGSFMVIEAESLAEAEAAFGRDPFVKNGLFDSITIKPYRIGVNNTKK